MASLIIVIISIALMAALAAASVNYVPIEAVLRQATQKEAMEGVAISEGATIRYLDLNRDGNGNIIYPGDGVNMAPVLFPAYGFKPSPVRGEMGWEYTTGKLLGAPAVSICLYPLGTSSNIQREALAALQRQAPVGSTFLSNACGSTSDNADPLARLALTRWVVLAHHN